MDIVHKSQMAEIPRGQALGGGSAGRLAPPCDRANATSCRKSRGPPVDDEYLLNDMAATPFRSLWRTGTVDQNFVRRGVSNQIPLPLRHKGTTFMPKG